MKASELRIGNYIEKSLKSGQGRNLIGKIGCQDIFRISENSGPFNYDPIEITMEWVDKFGFNLSVKEGNQNEFRVYKLHGITYNTNHGWWWENHKLTIQPKHVHELQNLFFALTGEELKLTNE